MKLTRAFFEDIRGLIHSARATVARGVDLVQVYTNFEIGRRIVEQEQKEKGRAAYGQEVIQQLADLLTAEFGVGFSARNLASMKSFYLQYQGRRPILQSATAKLGDPKHAGALPEILQSLTAKSQSLTGKSGGAGIEQPLTDESSPTRPFCLSWTHYVFLLSIKNPDDVNTFDREIKLPEENPTIGIVLCRQKNKAIVEITLPKGSNIHASEYQLYLPSKELLQTKLMEWAKEVEK
jgi:DUF1016 N-terminal domain/YhcG PDDEXK nuclease domain